MNTWIEKPVIPGIRHLPGSGFWALLAGKGLDALSSKSNYQFVEKELRPYCCDGKVATFYAGRTPVVYVPNGVDMNVLSREIRNYSQKKQFGASGQFVGPRNIIQLDMSADDKRSRHSYGDAARAITSTTNNKHAMADFYRGITEDIEKMVGLEVSESSEKGFSLDQFTHVLAMDLGAKLLMGAEKCRPSELIRENPDYLDLIKEFTSRLAFSGDGITNYILRSVGLKKSHVDLKKEEAQFSEYVIALLEKNFPDICDKRNLPLQMKWKTKDFFGDKSNEDELFEFPRSWEEFKAFPKGKSAAVQEKYRDLLIDQAFLQIVSSETTAQAMNFGTRELLNNPDSMLTIRKEVEDLAHHGMTLEDVQPKDMSRLLPELSCFVMETLRLYTPAPLIAWTVKKDTTAFIEGESRVLKKGTTLLFDQEMANQLAFPDGHEFRPGRWTERPGFDFETALDDLKKGSDDFRTFAGGPRVCPGRTMAAMEVAKLLAVFSRYDLSSTETCSMSRSGREALRPDQDLHLQLVSAQA